MARCGLIWRYVMPQCPICNAAIWMGQRYCTICDNYLPNPEEEDHFCPQCGIRVAPQQRICPKCNASLMEMAGTSYTALPRARKLSPWVLGIFIGTSLVIVLLLLVLLFNKSSGPPQLMVTPPSPAASGQTPTTTSSQAETSPSAPTAPAAQEPVVPSAPAPPASPEVMTPTPSPPLYFVNIPFLALRDGPSMSSPQIATLDFKDKVELLDISRGWGRIRDVQRNIVGWSYMRYLVPVTADSEPPLKER